MATADEASRLISYAVYKPIIVLGALERPSCLLPYDNVVYTVVSVQDVKLLVREKRDIKFFVKLNTGMNRLGCDDNELKKIMYYVSRNNLSCEGIYTHFRNAEADSGSVREQYSEFERCSRIYDFEARHCCASNALYLDPIYHEDIARVGLSLYGYNPHVNGLKPVMSVKSPVLQLRTVKKGEFVGYGSFTLPRDCKVAVIRAGYGDGYRRKQEGKSRFVAVNGALCQVLGQICMDMCMVDVSGVMVKRGDDAYLLGGGVEAGSLAEEYGTVIYEVLTSFNDRVERVYVKE